LNQTFSGIQDSGGIRDAAGIRRLVGGAVISLTLLCSNVSVATQTETAPPLVLVSARPIHSIVSAVMSGTDAPELLISGSASPHTYALKPSDARKLENAEIIFWVGPELETFLQTPLRTLAASAHIHALSDTPGLISLPIRDGGLWEAHEHDEHDETDQSVHEIAPIDPHFWLDPRNGAAMAHFIAEILGRADPARAEHYRDNADGFATRMAELDAELSARIGPARAQDYIVFHDAYQYFESRYDLSPIGAVSVAADRPAGARRIVEIRNRIQNARVKCVFSPPQFPPRLVATLTENAETQSAELDDLGTDITAGAGLYEALLVRMADDFLSCLTR
jgi:zinc transport system substrate-binding protein